MKKALKIAGITLASLVGVVIIAAVIALNTIASSDRLTRILNKYVPQYVDCQMELGEASVTLFKTFPNLGVGVEHVTLVNPMEGSPSDTLAGIDELTVTLDIQKLLKEKKIVLRQCILENAFVNIFIDQEGNTNLNVFQVKENADTTVFSFDYLVDVEEIQLKNSTVLFTNVPDHFTMRVKGVDMDLDGHFEDNNIEAQLKMKVDDFFIQNYASPFAMTNLNLEFNGILRQFETVEGELTANKPDLQLFPSRRDAVSVTAPVVFSLKDLSGRFEKAEASMRDIRLSMDGGVKIADNGTVTIDCDAKSNDFDLKDFLSYLPEEVQGMLGVGAKDKLKLAISKVKVDIITGGKPHIKIGIQADDVMAKVAGQANPLMNLGFSILMNNNLTINSMESLVVNGFKAKVLNSSLDAQGILNHLASDPLFKFKVNGDVALSDVQPVLPGNIRLGGRTGIGLTTDFTVGDLTKTLKDFDFARLSASANLGIQDLVFEMDTIRAASPEFNVSVALPATSFTVDSKVLDAQLGDRYAFNTKALGIKGSVRHDASKTGILSQWNPNASFTLGSAQAKIYPLEENILASNLDFLFTPEILKVNSSTFRLAQSDLSMQGYILGIKEQMENHSGVVKGDFQLNTDLLNIKAIVDLINGLNLPDEPKPKEEIQPFLVPAGVDLTVGLNTKKTVYEDLDFEDLTGTVTMRDSTLLLQDISCGNKAAQMELSALYRSTQADNLFFAMDFRLADVQVRDFLHMIPYFDTLVPMLKTFDGQCSFGIDVSTRLGADYLPKLPTLRGEADIKGKNLTVNDEFTFTKITDLLGVSTDGELRVDNLDVQLSAQNSRIELWPSQIAAGKYGVVAEGFMTPDKNAEYHISLTESPFRMRKAVKIWGPLDKLKFELEPSKYPNHYTPLQREERKKFHIDLRNILSDLIKSRHNKKTESVQGGE